MTAISTVQVGPTTIEVFESGDGRLVRESDRQRETWFAVAGGYRSPLCATAGEAERWLRE